MNAENPAAAWRGRRSAALHRRCHGKRASGARRLKVALVTDIGGLNDKGFNHLSSVGLQRAQKQPARALAVSTVASSSRTRRTTASRTCQTGGAGGPTASIIAVGVLFEFGPLDDVAPAVPEHEVRRNRCRLRAVPLEEADATSAASSSAEQGGRLPRRLRRRCSGGADIRSRRKMVVRGVGANKVPAIVRFIAGYRAGRPEARTRSIKVLDRTTRTTRPSPTRRSASEHGARPASARARASSSRSPAVLWPRRAERGEAEATIWGIGVDADQSFLGTHILTSATEARRPARSTTRSQRVQANPAGFKTGFNTNLQRSRTTASDTAS